MLHLAILIEELIVKKKLLTILTAILSTIGLAGNAIAMQNAVSGRQDDLRSLREEIIEKIQSSYMGPEVPDIVQTSFETMIDKIRNEDDLDKLTKFKNDLDADEEESLRS